MSTSTDPPGEPLRKRPAVRGIVERLRRERDGRDPATQLAREQALRREAEAARATLRAIFE